MKKVLCTTLAAACMVFAANAQFGKSLKDIGKAATSAVTEVAGDAAAGQVATKISSWMDSNNRVVASDRLASVTSGMAAEGYTLNFKAYESAEANILCCADGSIRVYTAMIDLLTDDELYAVIANQIGHLVNKDVKNNMMKACSQDNAGNATSAQLNKILSLSGDKLGTIVNELIQIPYTDDQSKAADQYACTMLKNAGKKVTALSSALTKFAALEKSDAEADGVNTPYSAALKYDKVNSNNAARAALVK